MKLCFLTLAIAFVVLESSVSAIKTGFRRHRHLDLERGGKSKGSKGDDDDGGMNMFCAADKSPSFLAALGSSSLSSFWASVLATECDPVQIAGVYDTFFLPESIVTIQGGDVGLNDLEAIKAAFVGDAETPGSIAFLCATGAVLSWSMNGASAVFCDEFTVVANELATDGTDPIVGEPGALPSGREYTVVVAEDGELFFKGVNVVCPTAIGANECPAAAP